MTSAEFLYELRRRLSNLPAQEVDQAMSYYEEYFADAGPEGEADLINRLGTPAQVASTIIGEYAMKDVQERDAGEKKGSAFKTMWIAIIAVLASPIAIPLAAAFFVVILALLIAIFSVFLAFFVSAIAMVAAGLFSVGTGIFALFLQPIEGVALMGVGFLCFALGMAFFLGTTKLCQLTIRGITWIFASLLSKKGGQR